MQDRVDLGKIEESDAKRTPGKWLAVMGVNVCVAAGCARPSGVFTSTGFEFEQRCANAEHAVAAVNALPAMIAELRGLRQMTSNLEEYECPVCGGWPGEADGACPHCVKLLNIMGEVLGAREATKQVV